MLSDEQIETLRAKAEADWNSQADQHNQWFDLGRDEQDLLFARALLRHTETTGHAETEAPGPRADLKELLKQIPQQPQRQDATTAQLHDLRHVANRLGLYDAADILRGLVERKG